MSALAGRTPSELEASLGALLGDRDDARVLEDDELERFPDDAIATLDRAGAAALYVPAALGGRFERLDAVLALTRRVASHDISLAIAHGVTFLGAAPVWVGADARLARDVAQHVLASEPVSLALTEPDHGTDLVRMTTLATRTERGWTLHGAKWLVNNARRARLVTVLARTADAPGPGALTAFVVPNDAARGVRVTPKIRTLGVRAADISGLLLDEVEVGADAMIGREGSGLDVVLRALQLTRALCAGLSLGALDRATRITLRFAHERAIYGGTVMDVPLVRDQLADVAVTHLAITRVSELAARLVHLAPERASVASAVAKALVPTWAARALDELAVVMGARHFVRDPREHGLFQKILRDHRLVGLFDGSTVVNLAGIGAQLPTLLAPSDELVPPSAARSGPVPALAFDRLRLTARGPDGVIAAACRAPGAVAEALQHALERLRARTEAVRAREGLRFARAPETFRLASRYAELWAVAAVLMSPGVPPEMLARLAERVLELPAGGDTTEPALAWLQRGAR